MLPYTPVCEGKTCIFKYKIKVRVVPKMVKDTWVPKHLFVFMVRYRMKLMVQNGFIYKYSWNVNYYLAMDENRKRWIVCRNSL